MKIYTYLLSALAFVAAVLASTHVVRAQALMVSPTESMMRSSEALDRDDTLVQMTALHTQQTDLLSEAMRNEYMDTSDLSASRQAVMQNAAEISQLVNSQFGQMPQDVFDKYWNETMTLFMNYANGLQQGDNAMQSDALIGLHRNIIEASAMISEETDLPQDTVDSALRTHVNYLRGVIEAYANGNYEESFTQQMMAQEQIAQVAQTITDAWLQ